MAVALYHHGVVFDRRDIDRFLRTQLEVTWNGDMKKPQWFKVDGRKPWNKQSPYMAEALAPFEPKIEQFVYFGRGRDARVQNIGNAWQGGVGADAWLAGKYWELPRARGGKQIYLEAGNRFCKKQENRDFLKSLDFTVEPPGYRFHWHPTELEKTNPEKWGRLPGAKGEFKGASIGTWSRIVEFPRRRGGCC